LPRALFVKPSPVAPFLRVQPFCSLFSLISIDPLPVTPLSPRWKDIRLEIDGGVSEKNIKEVAMAGVDMFVAGSAIFKNPRTVEAYKETIGGMREQLAEAKAALAKA